MIKATPYVLGSFVSHTCPYLFFFLLIVLYKVPKRTYMKSPVKLCAPIILLYRTAEAVKSDVKCQIILS
jgi:hypothetical protein